MTSGAVSWPTASVLKSGDSDLAVWVEHKPGGLQVGDIAVVSEVAANCFGHLVRVGRMPDRKAEPMRGDGGIARRFVVDGEGHDRDPRVGEGLLGSAEGRQLPHRRGTKIPGTPEPRPIAPDVLAQMQPAAAHGRQVQIREVRVAGLTATLNRRADLTDDGDVALAEQRNSTRGASGLLAEVALTQMVGAVRDRTTAALQAHRLPLLVGGDCPVLLGGLAAARDHTGGVGVLFVDGHEDAWPPTQSTTGDAADCELGIALGRHIADLPTELAEQLPLLIPEAVTAVGPRDEHELADGGIESLADQITLTRPAALHTASANGSLAALTSRQANRLADLTGTWWLHVDLDVLATDQLSAVDYPQPGGLSWAELDTITAAALTSPGCIGWSVCIYNPDLDPDRSGAALILRYLDRALAARDHARAPANRTVTP